MAVTEVFPDPEYAEGNPYSALIATESNFDHGYIRIEPPVTISQDGLSELSDNVFVDLVLRYTDKHATELDFYVNEKGFGTWTDEQRTLETVKCLLNDLGALANRDIFMRKWNNTNEESGKE